MLGFSVIPTRLPWRALVLARATEAPFLLTIRGGYLRLAISTPSLLVVLLERIRPVPGRKLPADLELVLNGGALEGAMASVLMTRRTEQRSADLLFLFSLGDPIVRLRCGLDYAEVPVETTPVLRYADQDLVDALMGPRVPSHARYATRHLDLLRALLEPAGIQPHLMTALPGRSSDVAGTTTTTPQERDRHLDDTADLVQRSPGCYLDEHLIVRIQPDPAGIRPPWLIGSDPDA